jgi:hypothetical protein
LVSHVVYSFQLQLFLLKLMHFPSSPFLLYVCPIPVSVRWSTLYSVQKRKIKPLQCPIFSFLLGKTITCKYS